MAQPRLIKYLENGVYKYASVKYVGDLEKLKTTAKSDLVSAINSLIEGGGATSVVVENRISELEEGKVVTDKKLEEQDSKIAEQVVKQAKQDELIRSVKTEYELSKEDITLLQEIQEKSKSDITSALQKASDLKTRADQIIIDLKNKVDSAKYQEEYDQIKADLLVKEADYDKLIVELDDKVDSIEYQSKVEVLNQSIASQEAEITKAKTDITSLDKNVGNVRTELATTIGTVSEKVAQVEGDIAETLLELDGVKTDLQGKIDTANGDITTINKSVDDVKGQLSTTITNLNSVDKKVAQTQTEVTQTKEEVALKASQKDLDTATGKIGSLESSLSVQAGQIATKVTSNEVQSQIDTSKTTNHGYRYYKKVVIFGDSSDLYYPVIIKGGEQTVKRDILIRRTYSEQAPVEWNPSMPVHHGGLTVKIKTNFGGWGGANYSWEVHELEEMYSKTFAGAKNCGKNTMFAVFLRGGGTTGAVYHIYSDQPLDNTTYSIDGIPPSPQVAYDEDLIFKNIQGEIEYLDYAPAPRSYTQDVIKEIALRNFIKLSQTHETSITQLSNSITLKANATDVYTKADADGKISNAVNTAKSEIKLTTDGISQTVSSLSGKVITTEGEIDTLSSSISAVDQKADSIKSTVTSLNSTVTGQGTRLSSAETTIGQHTNSINLKANATDVYKKGEVDTALGKKIDTTVYNNKMSAIDVSINGINQTVSAQETEIDTLTGTVVGHTSQISTIDQKADGIAIRVGKTEGDISGIAGRVGSAETKITANTTAIGLKASQTSVNAIDGRVKTAEGQISVQAGEIAQRVTKTEYDANVGLNKWIVSRYNMNLGSGTAIPKFSHIKGKIADEVKEVIDAKRMSAFSGDNYVAHYFTNVYMNTAKTVSLSVTRDDTAGFYLNGALITEGFSTTATPTSLSLRAGWNTVEILFYEHTGAEYVDLGVSLSSQVDKLTAHIGIGDKNDTRLKEAETSIIQTEKAITLKANATDVTSLGNRVTTTEGSISVLNNEIASKVAKTDFDAYSKRVSNAESTITQLSNSITQKVSQTDYDKLNGRVSTAEASIVTQADQIASKVSKTDFDKTTDRLTKAESSIVQTADSITQKISSIKIGGRNLLKNSKEFDKFTYSPSVTSKVINADSLELTLVSNVTGYAFSISASNFLTNLINVGDNVSVSFEAKLKQGDAVGQVYYKAGMGYKTFTQSLEKDKWVKLSQTREWIDTGTLVASIHIGFISRDTEVAPIIELRNIMVENGDKITDWTPAVEDIDNGIKAVANRVEKTEASLTIQADQIASKVSSTQVTTAINTSKRAIDTRNVNQPPSYYWKNYPMETVKEFKSNGVIGITSANSSFSTLITIIPWTDKSGGEITQTATTSIFSYTRRSNGVNDAWTAWEQTELVSGSQAKVDALEIGGRNLILNSDKIKLLSNNNAVTPIETAVVSDGIQKVRRIAPFTSLALSTYTQTFYDTVIGETYMVSCKVKPEKEVILRLSNGAITVCKPNVWTTLSYKVVADAVSTRLWGLYGTIYEDTGWIEYKEYKVEKGDKVTDWQPAPEDIQTQFSEMETSIVQTKESIELKASKTEVADAIKTSEASISVKANEIASTVATTTINDLKIGGRNLFKQSLLNKNIASTSKLALSSDTNGFSYNGWAGIAVTHDDLKKMLKPNTQYTISYKYRVDELSEGTTPYEQANHGTLLLYSGATGHASVALGGTVDNLADTRKWVKGDVVERVQTFTTPATLHDVAVYYRIIAYSSRRMKDGVATIDSGTFYDVQIEEGKKATGWNPSPEDIKTQFSEMETKIVQTDTDIRLSVTNAVNGVKQTIDNRDGSNLIPTRTGWEIGSPSLTLNQVQTKLTSSIRLRYFDNPIPIIGGATYTYSNSNMNYCLAIHELDENLKLIKDSYWLTEKTKTFDTLAKTKYVRFLVRHAIDQGQLIDLSVVPKVRFKLEKGDKATAWALAPEDVDSSIKEVSERISLAQASIDVQAGQIKSKVSQEEVNVAIGNIQVGGTNLLKGTRDFTIENWYNTVSWIEEAELFKDFKVYKRSELWSGLGALTHLDVGTYTFSFYAKSDVVSSTTRVYTLPSDTDNVIKANVSVDSIALNLTANWKRHSITFKITSAGYVKLRLENATNNTYKTGDGHTTFICAYKLENGNIATDWSPAPEDVSDSIYDLTSRMQSAEQAINEDSIIATVTSSRSFADIFDAKADSKELAENYVSNGLLSSELTKLDEATLKKIREEIGNIDIETFEQFAELKQTATSISANFRSAGGVNLIKNSVGFAGFDFWTKSGAVDIRQNEGLDVLGYGSGFYSPKGAYCALAQTIPVTPNKSYTLTIVIDKSVDGTTDAGVGADIYDGATKIRFIGKATGLGNTVGYETFTHTFTPTTNTVKVNLIAGANSVATITGAMLNVGSEPLQWTMAHGEIYNASVKFDMKGIKVSKIEDDKETRVTVMTPEKFAGYYDVNGDGVIDINDNSPDEVFKMDDDSFVMKKAVMKEEISMGTVKVIDINTSTSKGWAFIADI